LLNRGDDVGVVGGTLGDWVVVGDGVEGEDVGGAVVEDFGGACDDVGLGLGEVGCDAVVVLGAGEVDEVVGLPVADDFDAARVDVVPPPPVDWGAGLESGGRFV
jgi:hypothetical protein